MSQPDDLAAVDAALVRLRRLWTGPPPSLDDDGEPVEMSSLLVVEGCARLSAAGLEVSVGRLAEFADVQPSTASRLVDRAAAAGLLERRTSPDDRRRTSLVLTPAGQALRERAVAFRTDWLRRVLAGWEPAEVATLGRLLTRFTEAVTVHGPPGRS